MSEDSAEKKSLRKLEDRLVELLNWGINPEVKVAKDKYLNGEMYKVYQDGCIELIYGSPYKVTIKEATHSSEDASPMYRAMIRESSLERAKEVLEDRSIVKRVAIHALYHPQQRVVYMFEYLSRDFLKEINPNYPKEYLEPDEQYLESIKNKKSEDEVPFANGGRRKTSRGRKTNQ